MNLNKTNILLFLLSTVLVLSLRGNYVSAQEKEVFSYHHFEGEIMRSFAVNPTNASQMLIGLKGDQPNSGKVYLSEDAGVSWEPLNKGEALCGSCKDVQTVCFVNEETFLAGTWKNGLFLSTNSGKKFSKVKDFPATDIRSIVKAPAGMLYASTTTHGVLISEDEGKTWSATHEADMNKTLASWKLAIAPGANKILYAMTFGNGIYKSINGGISWKQAVFENEVMIWDIAFTKNELYAIGSNESGNYLFHSYLGEKKWKTYKLNLVGQANSLHVAHTFLDYQLYIGTWGDGVQSTYAIEYSNDGYRCSAVVKDDTVGVQDIYSNENYIYNFSWGDGLKIIEREKECAIKFPKSITPATLGQSAGNSGIQTSCKLDFMNFKFYNRWGELVYQTTSSLDSVNAYFKSGAKQLADGEYIYWMKSSFSSDSDTSSLTGHINLLK